MRKILILAMAAVLVGCATMQKQRAAEHFAQTTEPFTIAVLPDTQFYCDTRLKLSAKWGNGDLRRYFFEQTRWVRDNQKRLNIAFLVHEGDIVQADGPEEWAIAKKAMSVLDGKVPYCMCLGNHDMGFEKADNKYGGNIGVNRTTHFNTYFPREKFAKRREFGGTFAPDRHDNSWYHFEAAEMNFLIVALECKPRDEVLVWANKVVAKHSEHRVIVLTHAYMNKGKSRNTGGMSAKGNTGEQTWQKFVKKHKNIFMVLCGHHAGEAVRTDAGDHGNKVHQILSDYQHLNNGGESWLRYMVFKPGANKISIYTYNPALDKFKNGPSSRFDLDYPMAQPPVTAPGIRQPGAANDVNKAAEQSPAGKEKQDKVSTPMVNNAWGNLYKFHQSRAHYRSGKTYLAWVGPDNHPYVSVYSHKKNEWSAHERVGTNLISPQDYHGNPSILIDREGFLHVFYGGHSKKMRYSRSSKPLSNDDWQDYTSRLPYTESTYPQLFVMSDGTIYSFYRRKTHRGNWSYVTSKDNGSTWSREVHVLDGRSPPGNGWYTAFTKDPNRDHIHLMFLWHASKDNLPHSRRNLYYMQMDHSTGKWTSMENEKLNTPISFEEANGKVMIFDSKNKYSSIPQHWLTVDGRPVGLNRISDKDGADTRHLHVWTGESWRTQKVPIDVILKPTKKEWVGFRSREGTVQRFTSKDEGAHWTPGEVILKTDGEQNLNALFAEAHPDAVLAIVDKVDEQWVPGKQRLWVWGDAGFLE